MKKIITLICLMMVITCNATRVPIEKARITARNFYLERVNIHSHHDQVAITGEFTINRLNEPVYYIFNMDNEGFIIVSAVEESYPVLAYSFEGTYKPNSGNREFNYWMDNYSVQIMAIRENQYKADRKITEAWVEYSNESWGPGEKEILDVEPMVTSKWGQSYPYNTNCPYDLRSADTNFIILDSLSVNMHNHVPTGCVATAMGMILEYWRYPLHGLGEHCDTLTEYGDLCVNYAAATYEWNAMTDFPVYENDPVALLLYHSGVGVNMFYEYNQSAAMGVFVPEAYITHFKYAPEVVETNRGTNYSFWISLLKLDLNNGWPIQYGGNGPGGGHSFVCDGYQGNDYFHMNWGWEGLYNGYFYLDNLNPGTFTFNQDQHASIHIHPPQDQYPAYCSGQVNLITHQSGSIEDGSGPVMDYLGNTDCRWLIAPDDSIAMLTLNFVKFRLHQSDTLKVYDGENASAALIGSYTGTSIPESITATGQKLFLRFITDDSLSANGFLVEYNTTEYQFCNDTVVLSDLSGVVSDGSGRFKYRNGSTCVTKIYRQWADSVYLKFTQINTEAGRDTINIYDLTGNELIASYSGSYMTPPAELQVTGPGIFIVFKTDSLFRKAGWKANYRVIEAVKTKEQEPGNFRIYPNPARDYCIIETSSIESGTEITLINTNGITMMTQHLEKQLNYLELSSINPGVYLLRIKTESGNYGRKLVVY